MKILLFRDVPIRHVVLSVLLVAPAVAMAEYIATEDVRESIVLLPDEREHVLAEMRTFMYSVQQITKAISDDDIESASKAAKLSGFAGAGAVPGSMKAKLPKRFKKLGHDTHRRFDALALDAEQLGDSEHALSQLADLLENCVACHSAYRVDLPVSDR